MEIPGLDAPLRTIWCIGRNYAAHARELGSAPPAQPIVFLKPLSAVNLDGGVLHLPPDSARVDHEVELVIARGRDGRLLMAVGVDFTARDIQERDKAQGLPWTSCKGRPGFAALGAFVPPSLPAVFQLSVNGEIRQRGNSAEMIFSVEKLLEHIDAVYGLAPGDVVYTGTPAGVSPLKSGDRVKAELSGGGPLAPVSRLTVTVV